MITTDIALCVSIILFTIGILLTIYYIKRRKGVAKRAIIGLICSTAIAFFPLYLMDNHSTPGGILDVIFTALLGVARSMMGENSLLDTRESFLSTSGELSSISAVYTSFLHVVATLLLLGLLFSFFENFFPKIRYHLFSTGHLTIFSNVSDRTVLLAKDMKLQADRGKKKNSTFVFLDDLSRITIDNARYLKELKSLNAFLFNEGTCEISLPIFFKSNSVDYFLLQDDDTINMKEAIELSQKWSNPITKFKKKKLDIRIHIRSNTPEAEHIVDSIEYDSSLKFRLIRETRTALYNLVDKYPLFLGIRENNLTVLIIGAGQHGIEAIKTVAWCGQTLHITPKIIVVDKSELVSKQFAQDCPEFISNGDYAIDFITVDVTTEAYSKLLRTHPEIGYIICTLSDESLNIKTAMHTRGIYDDIRFLPENACYMDEPLINILINHPFLHDVMGRMQFDTKQNCHLNAFGSIAETYTWENITGSYLDCIGIAINRFYELDFAKQTYHALSESEWMNKKEILIKNADENYEKKEYNRCSSIALGLHSKYKIYAILVESAKNALNNYDWSSHPTSELIKEADAILTNHATGTSIVEELSVLEHRRWNAYMRSQGWRTVTTEQMNLWYDKLGTKHRNFAAKLTPCLIDWDDLPLLDKALKDAHPESNTDFQMLDRIFVKNLAAILHDANTIYDITYKH